MATIVNTTPGQPVDNTSNGMGFLVGVIVLLAVIFLFFFYGLPLLAQSISGLSGPQVQVPGKIDVNVNNPQGK